MGSSIRRYLWPCCGVFYQIPTLAGVLTSSGEGYDGSEGADALSPFVSCLFSASLPVLCPVSSQTTMGMGICSLSVCMSHTYSTFKLLFLPYVFDPGLSLCVCLIHAFYTFPSTRSVCVFIHKHIHAHVPCDFACACDCWRPCDWSSEGWPVDTEPS